MQPSDYIPNPLRILHLENDPDDAELVRHVLIKENFNAVISRVDTHDAFLDALKQQSVDLILADCALPAFDGFEALNITLERSPGIPFVFVSGAAGESLAVSSVKAGATDYVLKTQLERLAPAVRRALREVKERNARRSADERARLLMHTVESIHEMVVITGLDNKITYANRACLETYGYQLDELLGRHFSIFFANSTPPSLNQEIPKHSQQGGWKGEVLNRSRDGREFLVSLSASNIRNDRGEIIGLVGIAEEITDRKRSEEALRASEHHYRLLFESSPIPIYMCEEGTLRFLAVNEAAVLHYGFSREDFLSLSLRDLALPEDVPVFLEKLSSLGSATGDTGIWHHRTRDGKLVEMEITCHPLAFAGKKAWLSLAMDVTERLSLEAQLRQSQKMESVGQLAGGIAHDFNNLLTVISGHAGLLLAREQLAPHIAEPLREISEASRRAAELTRQLLAFSRKQILQQQYVDLNDVVNNVSKMLRRILGEDIALEVIPFSGLPSVKADLGMIEQVLLNLAVNSRDAMSKGGRLRIQTAPVIIDHLLVRKNPEASTGHFVCLTFADTGCGIPPDVLPRIFEPFFTTKGIDRGTGLGLATVYGIIKQHQGWIQVTSQVDQGTKFEIYLPACAEKSGALPSVTREQRVVGGTETLLVVEDEAPLLKLIHHILESHGYKVLGCSTGKAALEIWEEHRKKIDLLFTDMVLPDGMTGPDLADILAASKPSLKIIYTSGYGTEKVAAHLGLREGLNFIQKPFHARKLAEVVHDCLNSK